jgi:hypothetical protein
VGAPSENRRSHTESWGEPSGPGRGHLPSSSRRHRGMRHRSPPITFSPTTPLAEPDGFYPLIWTYGTVDARGLLAVRDQAVGSGSLLSLSSSSQPMSPLSVAPDRERAPSRCDSAALGRSGHPVPSLGRLTVPGVRRGSWKRMSHSSIAARAPDLHTPQHHRRALPPRRMHGGSMATSCARQASR